jgi:hypothetical protein
MDEAVTAVKDAPSPRHLGSFNTYLDETCVTGGVNNNIESTTDRGKIAENMNSVKAYISSCACKPTKCSE